MATLDASYRTAPSISEPATVIRYRANGPLWLLYLTGASLLLFAAGLIVAAAEASRAWLDCSRTTHLCTLVQARPGQPTLFRSLPIPSIRRVELTRTKSAAFLDLVTTAGDVRVSSRSGSLASREAQKQTIEAFLADGAIGSVHVDLDKPSPMAFVLLGFSVATLFFLRFSFRRAVVRFDWMSRVVVVERPRWPWPPWTRVFQLDEITGAEVSVDLTRRDRELYSVVLITSSGPNLTLLARTSSGPDQHERVAARIRAAIAHKEQALRGALA